MDSKLPIDIENLLKVGDELESKLVSFEQHQRQFLCQLQLKRIQVDKLREEQDVANLEMKDLARTLETEKFTHRDLNLNLNLMQKKIKFFEDKLLDGGDNASKAHLQHELLVVENKALKDELEAVRKESHTHTRTLEELKMYHENVKTYRTELQEKEAKIGELIAAFTEKIVKVENNSEYLEAFNKSQICKDLKKSLEFSQNEISKIKREHRLLKEKYIIANAKMEKLEDLCQLLPTIRQQDNLDEYIDTMRTGRQKIIELQETAMSLAENLKALRQANTALIIREDEILREKLTTKVHKIMVEASTQNGLKNELIDVVIEN